MRRPLLVSRARRRQVREHPRTGLQVLGRRGRALHPGRGDSRDRPPVSELTDALKDHVRVLGRDICDLSWRRWQSAASDPVAPDGADPVTDVRRHQPVGRGAVVRNDGVARVLEGQVADCGLPRVDFGSRGLAFVERGGHGQQVDNFVPVHATMLP